jgi:hypothetical protein
MSTGDLVASRFIPGPVSNGSVTANKLVLEYNSGLAQPSPTTTTITTSEHGATSFSNDVQVGENGQSRVTAGIFAFTGLAVQAAGMPSSLSTLSPAIDLSTRQCLDPTMPCTLTLTGTGPGVYSVGVSLGNVGNPTPEVS